MVYVDKRAHGSHDGKQLPPAIDTTTSEESQVRCQPLKERENRNKKRCDQESIWTDHE